MTSRDARYRSQAAVAMRRSEHYRTLAIDALAALIVQTGDVTWADLFGDEHPGDLDHADLRRRVAELRATLVGRTR